MGKVADMIILNLLTLVLSIPIVTFGAAYTAKYYVSMKIVRGDEGTLFKPYFKAFKENQRVLHLKEVNKENNVDPRGGREEEGREGLQLPQGHRHRAARRLYERMLQRGSGVRQGHPRGDEHPEERNRQGA